MISDDYDDAVIDADLLRILACPLCPERPQLSLVGHFLVCDKCHNAFPIVDGIPRLTPEDAVSVDQIKGQIDG